MAEESKQNKDAQSLDELQAHLTTRRQSNTLPGLKTKNGQAEKLMCDLETVAASWPSEKLTHSAMNRLDDKLERQARTKVLHEGAEDERKIGTPEALCHKGDVEGLSQHMTMASCNPMRAQGENNHDRDERIRRMEGPAITAPELAEKLAYFTYYELLYLDDDATSEEIHQAYVKRTTDIRSRFRSGIEEWRLSEFIRALHEAHSVLTNERLRKEYDERLAAGNWFGGFRDLVERVPDYKEGLSWAGGDKELISLKDLMLCGGFVTQTELDIYEEGKEEAPPEVQYGPELAQKIADAGLITFEELASLLLGKALIDRRQITVEQFRLAVGDMREHSHKLIDVLINQGWLTPTEKTLINID